MTQWRAEIRDVVRAERAAGVQPAHILLQLAGMWLDLPVTLTVRGRDFRAVAYDIDSYVCALVRNVIDVAASELAHAIARDTDAPAELRAEVDEFGARALTDYATVRAHVATIARRYPDAITLRALEQTPHAWLLRACDDALEMLLVAREVARTLLRLAGVRPGELTSWWARSADDERVEKYHAHMRATLATALRAEP